MHVVIQINQNKMLLSKLSILIVTVNQKRKLPIRFIYFTNAMEVIVS